MALKLVCKILALLFASSQAALAQQADLSVELELLPYEVRDGVLIDGFFQDDVRVGFLAITVSNNGPSADAASYQITTTTQPDGSISFPVISFLGQESGSCFPDPVLSPVPGAPIGIRNTPELQAGEDSVCVYAFIVGEDASSALFTNVLVPISGIELGVDDPVEQNDSALLRVFLGSAPRAVPFSLETSFLLVLLIVLTVGKATGFNFRTMKIARSG